MKIGVVANPGKPGAGRVLRELLALAESHGASIRLEAATARILRRRGEALRALVRKIDLLVVIGGDGSLLRVIHGIYPSPVPVLGINLGRLGFLTAVRHDELAAVLPDVFRGRLRTSPRHPLRITIHAKRGKRKIACALNDVVFNRSSSRMALIRVEADGLFVNEYIADGLIVATATGSTAYSLAAGGPIIAPEAPGLLLTPLCPHTLSNRGLVLAGQAVLRLEAPTQSQPLLLQYDGCDGGLLRPGEWAEVSAAPAPVNLAFLDRRDFFQILREKLKWSGASGDPTPGR
jgi:NAD+ kinase